MDPKTHISTNNNLQAPVTPITGMAATTRAPNELPAPAATAARTSVASHGASPSSVSAGRARY